MKGQRVLVVEDEAIVRESLEDWLKEVGYEVTTAEDGEQALRIFGGRDFGVLVLDLKLPGKDGIEVLRMAKAQKPGVKGIIITAYPSVETAAEAIKAGAMDYLPKPFTPDVLERLIEQAFQSGVKEAGTEAIVGKGAEIARREREISAHIGQGKSYFRGGDYTGALKELEQVLVVVPGNLEVRVWIQKAKRAIAEPETAGVEEAAKLKECVWVSMGVVSYRTCTSNYDCMSCEFDQMTRVKMASGGTPELDQALAKFRELPGSERLCRHAIKGDVSHRLCSRLFQCATCEFGQMMDDALQQQLIQRLAELAARQQALRRKNQNWWWSYWESGSPKSLAGSHSSN